MSSLRELGYEIHPGFISTKEVAALAKEADKVALDAGSTCVRHLRERSELFRDFACSETLNALLPDDMRPVRAILFDKTPQQNWPVAWHQDLTIAVKAKHEVAGYGPWSVKDGAPHVQPPSALLEKMITLRIHLDPTPADNGALRVIPRSHLNGKMQSPAVSEEYAASAVTCACDAGDVLMMSPLILHASSRSMEPKRRRIVHYEYACDEDLDVALEWLEAL